MQIVTVQTVNFPKPGTTFGSIKSTDGVYYSVDGGDLQKYRAGQTFNVEPRVVPGKTPGKVFYWMPKGFDPNTVGAIIPQPNGHTPTNGAPANLAPRPTGNGSTYSTPKQMFIMGVVGRALGSGKFGADDIRQLTAMAADAWEAHG